MPQSKHVEFFGVSGERVDVFVAQCYRIATLQAPENTTVPKAFHHMHPTILLKIQPRTLMGYFRTLDPTDFLRAQGAR